MNVSRIKVNCVAMLMVVLMFMPSVPAQAATYAELSASLQQLQLLLIALQSQGKVLGATSVTVSTQTELANAIRSATGGETILLNPGNYGALWIENGPYNKLKVGAVWGGTAPTLTSPVIITSADPSNRAVLEQVEMRNASYWHFKNLSFRPLEKTAAVITTSGGNNAVIGCDISYGDSNDWTLTNWQKVSTAINLAGNNNEVAYNYIKNVSLGIAVGGAHVHHNIIDGFAADGMRAWDDSVIEHNIIRNPIAIDDNHTDGFQSFVISGGSGTVKNVTLRSNTIVDSTFDTPMRTTMQGIGLFDGPYDNWMIENNLVVVDHWHGISLYGSRNSTIRNNVVLDPNTTSPGAAWVKFFPRKSGDLTVNGVLSNNYSQSAPQGSGDGVTSTGNVQVPFADYDKYFVDYRDFDYTIKPGALPFTVGATISSSQLAPEPKVGRSTNGTVSRANTNGTTTVATTTPPVINPPVTPPADGWTYCAAENNLCSFTGTKQVRYGENGIYFTKTFTGSVMCNNTTFGDPLKTVKKHCDTAPVSTVPTPTAPTLSLSVYPSSISTTMSPTLTWSSSNVSSCTASGAWSGTKSTSGTAQGGTQPVGTATFTLTCTGTSGTAISKSVQVQVTATVVDTDRDTISDSVDNCPNIANTDQKDTDGDKMGDACDSTPTLPPSATSTLERVVTLSAVNVRQAANGTKLGVQQKGAQGILLAVPSVVANGYTWVYINFDSGVDGWVADVNLSSSTGTTPTREALMKELLARLLALQTQLAELQRANSN